MPILAKIDRCKKLMLRRMHSFSSHARVPGKAIGSLPCWIIAEGGVCYRELGTWQLMLSSHYESDTAQDWSVLASLRREAILE